MASAQDIARPFALATRFRIFRAGRRVSAATPRADLDRRTKAASAFLPYRPARGQGAALRSPCVTPRASWAALARLSRPGNAIMLDLLSFGDGGGDIARAPETPQIQQMRHKADGKPLSRPGSSKRRVTMRGDGPTPIAAISVNLERGQRCMCQFTTAQLTKAGHSRLDAVLRHPLNRACWGRCSLEWNWVE